MKKLVSILIAGAMLMLTCVSSMAAFTDMPEGNDGIVLQRAVDNGLIQGFEDGTVQPATPITRAQMATIMSRAMNASAMADLSAFSDVNSADWFYEAMSKAVAMEAFKGDDKSQLNPNNTITRQEAMIVLCRIFDMKESGDYTMLDAFPDSNDVASWALKEVNAVVSGGYLEGVSAIRPFQPMTRLEFAQIMDKIVNQYIDEDGEYTSVTGNVLVRAQNVKFTGVKCANIYTGDGVTGNIEFTDCDAKDVIIRGGIAVVNSGAYERIRAIGGNTKIQLKVSASSVLKTLADGKKGNVYAKPGKGIVSLPAEEIEIK